METIRPAERRVEFTVGGRNASAGQLSHCELPGLDEGVQGRFAIGPRGDVYFSGKALPANFSARSERVPGEMTYLGKFWLGAGGRINASHSSASIAFKTGNGKAIVPVVKILESHYLSGGIPKDAFPVKEKPNPFWARERAGFIGGIQEFKKKITKRLGLQK